jgi:hypothetical protein
VIIEPKGKKAEGIRGRLYGTEKEVTLTVVFVGKPKKK